MKELRPIEQEIQDEVSHGEFADKIKDTCSWCGEPIPATVEWYMAHGCACLSCLARFNKRIEDRKKLKHLNK